jgi:hypothetical protein
MADDRFRNLIKALYVLAARRDDLVGDIFGLSRATFST